MPQMFPMDPLRNITFLALDIDRNVGGPPTYFLAAKDDVEVMQGLTKLIKTLKIYFDKYSQVWIQSLDKTNQSR